jgi:hypothetical protein
VPTTRDFRRALAIERTLRTNARYRAAQPRQRTSLVTSGTRNRAVLEKLSREIDRSSSLSARRRVPVRSRVALERLDPGRGSRSALLLAQVPEAPGVAAERVVAAPFGAHLRAQFLIPCRQDWEHGVTPSYWGPLGHGNIDTALEQMESEYLRLEWDRQVALGRDPRQVLGDNPPW